MATDGSKVTDTIEVALNGESTKAKGPDPDRLKGHANESRRFKESPDEVKGPSPSRD